MSFNVEVISRWADVLPNAAAWDRLVETCLGEGLAPAHIFLTFDYVATWWSILATPQDALRIFVARDLEGEIVGIAPMMIARSRTLGGTVRYLQFIGSAREPRSEYLDYIVAPDRATRVSQALTDALFSHEAGRWHFLRLCMIAEGSHIARAIEERAQHAGVPARVTEHHVAPYIQLSDSLETVIAERPPKLRTNIRSSWRKAQAQSGFAILQAPDAIPLGQAVDVFLDLHAKRWLSEGRTLVDERSRRFFHELAGRLVARDRLMLSVVMLHGKPAAATYDFLFNGRVYGYQAGWDPAHSKLGLGNIMRASTVRWAIARGAREFDLLVGDEPYKLAWMSGLRSVVDLEIANPRYLVPVMVGWLRTVRSLVHRIRLIAATAGSAAQAAGKQLDASGSAVPRVPGYEPDRSLTE